MSSTSTDKNISASTSVETRSIIDLDARADIEALESSIDKTGYESALVAEEQQSTDDAMINEQATSETTASQEVGEATENTSQASELADEANTSTVQADTAQTEEKERSPEASPSEAPATTPDETPEQAEIKSAIATEPIETVETAEQEEPVETPIQAEVEALKEPAAAQKPVPPATAPTRKRISPLRLSLLALVTLLLISSVAPLSISLSYAVNAYNTYQALRVRASSGTQHLLNVKAIFAGTHINSTSVIDPNKLTRANKELAAARQDFVQIQQMLKYAPSIRLVNQELPQYRSQIRTARAASQVGIDIADIGQNLINCVLILEPRFRSPLLAANQPPLVTATDINLIGTTIDRVIPSLDDMQRQIPNISLSDLPISAQMRHQLQTYIPFLPRVKSSLLTIQNLLEPAQWLLGVNEPRTFLVQTMDRSELRPTGGFTGQYGELQISGGRVAPFSLRDIALLEYGDHSPVVGDMAPSPYRSWWPFANWGLRDSNLSADFPTSAKIAMKQYKDEVKHNVDGVILLTPALVQHILYVIGPVQIPRYNETITADNLEQRLHYYQLDNAGIRRIEIIEHVEDPATARKLFTSEVARTVMERIRHAPLNELLAIGMQLLQDLKTKDLQVYVTNQQIEDLLRHYGYSAEIDRSTAHDGLFVVQTNVSASKASQYIRTILQDQVTLDAQGGATHVLQMRLIYSQLGPVYGLDTYRDYVRIYVPPSAKLLWGDGFDSGQPLCGGPLPNCPAHGVYPQQELVCPTGQYQAGYAAPMLDDPYAGAEHPLDKIGPPTARKSDEPERGMFGGYVVIPKNCTMTVTLSWYVPTMGNNPYSLLIQRQSGTYPDLTLNVQPSPGDCATQAATSLYFNGVLTKDTTFALKKAAATPNTTQANCRLKA